MEGGANGRRGGGESFEVEKLIKCASGQGGMVSGKSFHEYQQRSSDISGAHHKTVTQ